MKNQKKIKRSTLLYGGIFFAAGLISFILKLREEGAEFTDAIVWLVLGSVIFRYVITEDRLKETNAELKALKERAP